MVKKMKFIESKPIKMEVKEIFIGWTESKDIYIELVSIFQNGKVVFNIDEILKEKENENYKN